MPLRQRLKKKSLPKSRLSIDQEKDQETNMPMTVTQRDHQDDATAIGVLAGVSVSDGRHHEDGTLEEDLIDESGPTRRCIVTGALGSPELMMRFVVGPDDQVHPDFDGRLPGRGLWLQADGEVLRKAIDKKAFSRAARKQIGVQANLAERVCAGLQKRCLETTSLARRAGQIISGYERVIEALATESGRWVAVLEATDATQNAITKMRGPAADRPVMRFADGAAMGRVLGRDRCVHACIACGGLADRLLRDAGRLAGFLSARPVQPAVRSVRPTE